MTNCMLSSAQEPALHLQFTKPFMGTMAVETENTHALKTYMEDNCLQSWPRCNGVKVESESSPYHEGPAGPHV